MSRIDDSGVPNTCPFIDDVIKAIKSAISNIEDFIKAADMLTDDFKSQLEDAKSDLNVESNLEDIRGMNSQLRGWGQEQYEKVIELENEKSELEHKISVLTDEIEELQSVTA